MWQIFLFRRANIIFQKRWLSHLTSMSKLCRRILLLLKLAFCMQILNRAGGLLRIVDDCWGLLRIVEDCRGLLRIPLNSWARTLSSESPGRGRGGNDSLMDTSPLKPGNKKYFPSWRNEGLLSCQVSRQFWGIFAMWSMVTASPTVIICWQLSPLGDRTVVYALGHTTERHGRWNGKVTNNDGKLWTGR